MAGTASTFDLPEASRKEQEEQEGRIREFELRRKVKATVVPTDDVKVRALLRQLLEPITLFGEKEMERRERLRRMVAERDAQGLDMPVVGLMVVEEDTTQRELFYTEGPEELKAARGDIAGFSLRRAKERVSSAKRRRDDLEVLKVCARTALGTVADLRRLAQQSSEIGDDRPIVGCEFSPDASRLATVGWGGELSVWSSPGCAKQWSVRAHEERCTAVTWHPSAATRGGGGDGDEGMSDGSVHLATASADCTAKLWSSSGTLVRKLEGHTDRLARLAFHPMGRHLATASYDLTWRLWDVETGACLTEQEGHSRAVYCVAFHPDGSLAASAGLDAIGRLWDCRTGRAISLLEGHVKQILGLDFSPNGYHVVTASDDHTCKVWDLRTKKCLYTIPAHRALVSCVRYERSSGAYLVSGGYDCLAKVWSGRDFSLVKTLAGHEGKVMCVDVAPTGSHVMASVSYDRTIKLWAPEAASTMDL